MATSGAIDAVVEHGWIFRVLPVLVILACVLCAFACLTFACIAAVKLQEMRGLLDRADARMVELKRHYESMQPNGGGNDNGVDGGIARQAAAWGAEVLSEVANGTPPDVAVQRSAARLQLPPVEEGSRRPAASEAGSDVSHASRVSELRGFDGSGNGWVTTTERDAAIGPVVNERPPETTLAQFAGYRGPPVLLLRQRAHTSPPRRMESY